MIELLVLLIEGYSEILVSFCSIAGMLVSFRNQSEILGFFKWTVRILVSFSSGN